MLLLALLYPILEFGHTGLVIWTSVFWVMLIIAVRSTRIKQIVNKTTYFLGTVLILLSISGLICYNLLDDSHTWIFTSINALTFIFIAFITVSLLYGILSSSSIGVDNLIGAASAYVLIGVTFAYGYIVLHSITGESLVLNENPAFNKSNNNLAFMVAEYSYFSFSTLTTLGFGDITPITLPARVLSCAEAILGQLFLTILVARLVGLHVLLASAKSDGKST